MNGVNPHELVVDGWGKSSRSCRTDPDRRGGTRRRRTTSPPPSISLGLIDHVTIDIVPVVFGRGKPYFGTLVHGHVMLEDPDVVIHGDGVLHVRYPVHGGR
jgi:hypothetical protein